MATLFGYISSAASYIPSRVPPPPPPAPLAHRRNARRHGASGSPVKRRTSPRQKRAVAEPLVDDEETKYALVDEINEEPDLYRVLGVPRDAKPEEIRRAYIFKSRVVHPDKFPNYEPSTSAFQKLSFAYQTLSKPSSRRLYDLAGPQRAGARGGVPGFDANLGASYGDETLNSVLWQVLDEFMRGDFEIIRTLLNGWNEGHGMGLGVDDDTIDSLEGLFRRIRDILQAGKKYFNVIRHELFRLYEIQSTLRQLSYFDVFGRLRLTLQLARVTLNIPLEIDRAMRLDDEEEANNAAGEEGKGMEVQRRGLLGPTLSKVIVGAVGMLERGETAMR